MLGVFSAGAGVGVADSFNDFGFEAFQLSEKKGLGARLGSKAKTAKRFGAKAFVGSEVSAKA